MDICLWGLGGHIVLPEDPGYNQARQDYNRAIQQYPLIINYCRNKEDVAKAVNWARRYRIPLRIRSGGHNYEGYSNGSSTLVVDVSEMNSVSLDEERGLLTLEGGVTNRQVYEFVSARGYPFPGGTCPTVGVSGYVTGGGWGLSCRYLGLGCDSLEEIELVNGEGRLIKASRRRNAELFWACRGAGGGNFGVIVSMVFRLPPKTDNVTLIEIDYLHATAAGQEIFLATWQQWLKDADPRITLIARIYNSANDGLAMLVRGVFYGEADEAKVLMEPFTRLEGAECSFQYVPFLEAVTIIGSNYPDSEKFQSVSRFVVRSFNQREITELVKLIGSPPPGSLFAGLSMYALGGKVREIGTDQTAFFYRQADYIIWLETIWEENRFAGVNRSWINRRFPALASVTTGSYVNFPYSRLANYLEEYYGDHAALLKEIKKEYDPCNIFTFPQGLKSRGPKQAKAAVLTGSETEEAKKKPADDRAYRRFRYVKNHADSGRQDFLK